MNVKKAFTIIVPVSLFSGILSAVIAPFPQWALAYGSVIGFILGVIFYKVAFME